MLSAVFLHGVAAGFSCWACVSIALFSKPSVFNACMIFMNLCTAAYNYYQYRKIKKRVELEAMWSEWDWRKSGRRPEDYIL